MQPISMLWKTQIGNLGMNALKSEERYVNKNILSNQNWAIKTSTKKYLHDSNNQWSYLFCYCQIFTMEDYEISFFINIEVYCHLTYKKSSG